MRETEIQKRILDYLQILENLGVVYALRTASGSVKTEEGRYFKTGKRGAADITLCYLGVFIAIEVKTSKGRQSMSQKQAQEKVEMAGGVYKIVRSVSDLIEALRKIKKEYAAVSHYHSTF